METLYFDANATSKVRPEAAEAVSAFLELGAANPSSVHAPGRRARQLLGEARKKVARLLSLGNPPSANIIFTSGATEGANLLIRGFLENESPAHVVSSAIEHAAFREPLLSLERSGSTISWISPGSNGIVDAESFVRAVRPDTRLVVCMTANNETGAIQPVQEISRALRRNGFSGPIVSDFTQVPGKALISTEALFEAGVDAITLSAHKIGGFAGSGAVVLPKEPVLCRSVTPLIVGGPQEEKFRGGTENLLGIVAFGAAAERVLLTLERDLARIEALRNELWRRLQNDLPELRALTPLEGASESLVNTLTLQVAGCRADDLVVALDLRGMCVSAGAACSSGKQDVSHVALEQLRSKDAAREVIRLSLDWDVSSLDIKRGAEIFIDTVRRMRRLNEPEARYDAC